MNAMFFYTAFNQNLASWNTASVSNMNLATVAVTQKCRITL